MRIHCDVCDKDCDFVELQEGVCKSCRGKPDKSGSSDVKMTHSQESQATGNNIPFSGSVIIGVLSGFVLSFVFKFAILDGLKSGSQAFNILAFVGFFLAFFAAGVVTWLVAPIGNKTKAAKIAGIAMGLIYLAFQLLRITSR